MSFTISPNMNLIIPTVGSQPGPLYATDIDNSLIILDQHSHSAGSGVQITPSGLNINSDLSFLDNNATFVRTIRFQPQVSALPGILPDLAVVYVSGSDLYYNDGDGNQVRITQSGSVAGAAGTITGLPSGTASASFGGAVFTFQAATSTPANIDGGSFVFRNNVASSKGLTLAPPNAMSADYSVTLPALPMALSSMTLDTSGNMGTLTFDQVGQQMTSVGADSIGVAMSSTGANAVAASRTRTIGSPVGIGGVAYSSSGVFNISSFTGAFVTVPLLTVTISTSGRPVALGFFPDGGNVGQIAANNGPGNQLRFVRNGTGLGAQEIPNSPGGTFFPASMFSGIDFTGVGTPQTITYTVEVKVATIGSSINIQFAQLFAYEL